MVDTGQLHRKILTGEVIIPAFAGTQQRVLEVFVSSTNRQKAVDIRGSIYSFREDGIRSRSRLRVDQAWGSAQIAVAAHNAGASYYGSGPGGAALVDWNGHPGDKWGWAATAGIRLNAPMIGPGDYFQAAVHYAVGR